MVRLERPRKIHRAPEERTELVEPESECPSEWPVTIMTSRRCHPLKESIGGAGRVSADAPVNEATAHTSRARRSRAHFCENRYSKIGESPGSNQPTPNKLQARNCSVPEPGRPPPTDLTLPQAHSSESPVQTGSRCPRALQDLRSRYLVSYCVMPAGSTRRPETKQLHGGLLSLDYCLVNK